MVTKDVDDNVAVAGVPARVVSALGAEGYAVWPVDEDGQPAPYEDAS